jgi:hypothetical protein
MKGNTGGIHLQGQIIPHLVQIILGVGGIQTSSNEGQRPCPKGNNSKTVKIHIYTENV